MKTSIASPIFRVQANAEKQNAVASHQIAGTSSASIASDASQVAGSMQRFLLALLRSFSVGVA